MDVMTFCSLHYDLVVKLITTINGVMGGCAVGGASADDVVHDVIVYRADYVLTGDTVQHNYSLLKRLAFSRLIDVRRKDRGAFVELDGVAGADVYDGINTAIASAGALADLLAVLPHRHMQVIYYNVLLGDSLPVVAHRVKLSYSAVRSVRVRALRKLRKYALTRYGESWRDMVGV